MADKDVNIKLKVTGDQETKNTLKSAGDAGKRASETIADGQKKAAEQTEKTNEKFKRSSGILGGLKTQVVGWIAGFAGLQTIVKLLDLMEAKLQRISNLIRDMHQNNLTLQELGQALELQTGTVDKQQFWSRTVSQIQKSGGLQSPQQASQILTALDINYGLDSGNNKGILKFAKDIAPMIGTANMGASEIEQFITLGKTVGVKPNKQAYETFFAKARAAFTKGDASNFGQYLEGLNTGTQGFLQAGGTFEQATAFYNQALAVTPGNTAKAATLAETITRLSGGGYEKPRRNIERWGKVKWSDLTPNEQIEMIVSYTNSFPRNQRVQRLVEAGFESGYANELVKFSGGKAMNQSANTLTAVKAANASDTAQLVGSYLQTPLASSRAIQAEKNIRDVKLGSKYASWENELQRQKQKLGELVVEGKDKFFVNDEIEPYLMITQDIADGIEKGAISGFSRDEKLAFQVSLLNLQNALRSPLRGRLGWDKAMLGKWTRDLYQDFHGTKQQQEVPTNIFINTNDVINNLGMPDVETERFTQDY